MGMRAKDLNEVYAELLRCQTRLQAVMLKHTREGDRIFNGCAETAALRRASLDLSKALARMRQRDRSREERRDAI